MGHTITKLVTEIPGPITMMGAGPGLSTGVTTVFGLTGAEAKEILAATTAAHHYYERGLDEKLADAEQRLAALQAEVAALRAEAEAFRPHREVLERHGINPESTRHGYQYTISDGEGYEWDDEGDGEDVTVSRYIP